MKNMIKRLQHFLQRDQDITLYEEFHYIYITIKETISILRNGNTI